jgi:hypothetical protein
MGRMGRMNGRFLELESDFTGSGPRNTWYEPAMPIGKVTSLWLFCFQVEGGDRRA